MNKHKLNIEKYCITSNTITYALVKNKVLNYFGNFPYNGVCKGFGFVPTWGVVVDNKTRQRYFGFLPYGQDSFYVKKNNDNINSTTFMDINEPRKNIPAAYITYTNLNKDKYLTSLDNKENEIEDYENRYIILKGLFLTSFLIHVMILDKYNDTQNIIITSASSKTSIALGFMLKQSNLTRNINVIGLTSKRNIKFVKDKLSEHAYDIVYTYDDIESINIDNNASYGMVDMAGNPGVINRIHQYFNRCMRFSSMVGLTHNKEWEKIKNLILLNQKYDYDYINIAQKKFGEKIQPEMIKYWTLFAEFSKKCLFIKKIFASKENIAEVYAKVKGDFEPRDGFIFV